MVVYACDVGTLIKFLSVIIFILTEDITLPMAKYSSMYNTFYM